jgi:hypothetical protein
MGTNNYLVFTRRTIEQTSSIFHRPLSRRAVFFLLDFMPQINVFLKWGLLVRLCKDLLSSPLNFYSFLISLSFTLWCGLQLSNKVILKK